MFYKYIVFTFDGMIKTTTISIEHTVRDTAKKTEAKKFRGGLSEYIEKLIIADLAAKHIKIKLT